MLQFSTKMARVVALTTLALLAGCASALASAGAPDPSFGTRGVAELPPGPSKLQTERSLGTPVLLSDGSTIVPTYSFEPRMRKGVAVGVKRHTVSLVWTRPDGSVGRRSAPVDLPKNLYEPRLERTPDGHLFILGSRFNSRYEAKSFFLLRLSADGALAPAPGAATASTNVGYASLPTMARGTTSFSVQGVALASTGRAYVTLRQYRYPNGRTGSPSSVGPALVIAVDPSRGLASDFAGGALVIDPSTDLRTSITSTPFVDQADRLLTVVRSTRDSVGGTVRDTRLIRHLANGTVDTSFGTSGTIDLDGDRLDTAYSGTPAITTLRGGDLLVRLNAAAERGAKTVSGIELVRFTANGQPVPTFGSGGRSLLVLDANSWRFGSGVDSSDYGPADIPGLYEQPDGKLVTTVSAGYQRVGGVLVVRDGVVRTNAVGSLDPTYEQHGYARFDVPVSRPVSARAIGMDATGRVVAFARTSSSAAGPRRAWLVRLLTGDVVSPPTSARLKVDGRSSCGSKVATACTETDNATAITGRVLTGGRPLAGASVVVQVTRRSELDYLSAPLFPVVRTNARGAFRLPIRRFALLPGGWSASARVIATPTSQRLDATAPVFFTIGAKRDIDMLKMMQRAQALAVSMSYILDDSDSSESETSKYCASIEKCFGRSDELLALVSQTAHPSPGKAGLLLPKRGAYTIITRADTTAFELEFVITSTPDDIVYSCRGDAAARKRWCPGGTWEDAFEDPFATARVDGGPFDYRRSALAR